MAALGADGCSGASRYPRLGVEHFLGELKDGEIKIDWKGDWTDVEIKSDGRSLKAKVVL